MTVIDKFNSANYGTKTCVIEEGGIINFDPDSLKDVVGGNKLTYDEYLDIQIHSLGKMRTYFEICYFNIGLEFMGQISKKTKDHICFERIYISGMYPDGIMFEGKEDHVWMDICGFEAYQIGNCVSFFAEVYRYLKTGNGKLLDYSLRYPKQIKKIDSYRLPADEELFRQCMDLIMCETCWLNEHCNRQYCILKSK